MAERRNQPWDGGGNGEGGGGEGGKREVSE